MAKLSTHQIRDEARKIVANSPGGIPYRKLMEQISAPNPETSLNTIGGSVWDLHRCYPQEIRKPSRGLFVPFTGGGAGGEAEVGPPKPPEFKKGDFFWVILRRLLTPLSASR